MPDVGALGVGLDVSGSDPLCWAFIHTFTVLGLLLHATYMRLDLSHFIGLKPIIFTFNMNVVSFFKVFSTFDYVFLVLLI